jgi:hypothetical protein
MENTMAPPRAVPSSGKQLLLFPGIPTARVHDKPPFPRLFSSFFADEDFVYTLKNFYLQIVEINRAEYLPTSTGPGRRACHCNQAIPYHKRRKGKSSSWIF